jgi:hypothetical protein
MSGITEGLQRSVNTRQDELGHLVERIPAHSSSLQRRSQIARVIVIVAGALVAARESIVGSATDSRVIVLFFSALGIVIAAITGMESYFKWEGRASELRTLGASARSTLRAVDSQWQMKVRSAQTEQERINALTSIITILDSELERIRDSAAKLSISLETPDDTPPRELYPA